MECYTMKPDSKSDSAKKPVAQKNAASTAASGVEPPKTPTAGTVKLPSDPPVKSKA